MANLHIIAIISKWISSQQAYYFLVLARLTE